MNPFEVMQELLNLEVPAGLIQAVPFSEWDDLLYTIRSNDFSGEWA